MDLRCRYRALVKQNKDISLYNLQIVADFKSYQSLSVDALGANRS